MALLNTGDRPVVLALCMICGMMLAGIIFAGVPLLHQPSSNSTGVSLDALESRVLLCNREFPVSPDGPYVVNQQFFIPKYKLRYHPKAEVREYRFVLIELLARNKSPHLNHLQVGNAQWDLPPWFSQIVQTSQRCHVEVYIDPLTGDALLPVTFEEGIYLELWVI